MSVKRRAGSSHPVDMTKRYSKVSEISNATIAKKMSRELARNEEAIIYLLIAMEGFGLSLP